MKAGIRFASVCFDYAFKVAARTYTQNVFKSTNGHGLRFTGTRAAKSLFGVAIRANVKDNRPEPH